MTIGSIAARVTLNADGVSTVFPVAIQAYVATDLSVMLTSPAGVETPLVLNSNYTLAPAGTLQPPAWSLTTLGPVLANGYTLQVFINPVQTQQTQYVQGQAFPSLAVQTNLDRLTSMVQRLQDQVNRSVRAPDGDVFPSMLLAPATQRALQYLACDAAGNVITVAALPGSTITAAGIGAVLYPIQTVETIAGVVPVNLQYAPIDPRRYATAANWSAVYAQVSGYADTSWPYYRGDHAQHPTQTNAIAGLKTFDDSLLTGTIGWHCTAFGAQALQFNGLSTLAGGTNTAFGYASLEHMIDGSGNTAYGPETMTQLTGLNSSHNNAFGYRGQASVTAGTQNNSFGFVVLTNLLTGSNNHGFGESVLTTLTVGNGNQAYGYQALFAKPFGDFTHAFGYQALFGEASGTITAITKAASAVITLSTVSPVNPFLQGCPIVVQGAAGMTQINGVLGTVTAIGGVSGAWTVTVNINSTGFSTYTTGGGLCPIGNAAFGYQAAFNTNYGGGNSVFGWQAGTSGALGINNCLFGWQAGNALNCLIGGNLGSYNVAMGYQALLRGSSCNDVIAIGQQAGNNLTTGSEHVIIGANAGQGVTTATNNVWVGSLTGQNLNGNNNTGCGFNAGTVVGLQTFTNTSSFGANAVPNASNQITLGDSGVTTLRCQVTTITALSDGRDKWDIQPLSLGLDYINQVQFRQFKRSHRDGTKYTDTFEAGIIAQELRDLQTRTDTAWMDLVLEADPDRLEATPGKLLYPMGVAIQELSARLEALEQRLH